MLFAHLSVRTCQRALRAAIAAHRPAELRALLVRYGEPVFAKALARFSRRVIDDALSMLPASDRTRILNRLPMHRHSASVLGLSATLSSAS